MREDFLNFIWKNQYFDKTILKTTQEEDIVVFKQGLYNIDSGPDFNHCRIKINFIEWVGNVEIHYKSSDWYKHHHHLDKAYDNVILHVVWKDDKPVKRTDGTLLPTLELQSRIDLTIINNYKNLIRGENKILCHSFFSGIDDIFKSSMIEKVAIERLKLKAENVLEILSINKGDWEQTAYTILASNFGFKLNSEPFKRLSISAPFNIIKKHLNEDIKINALLFGVAGLLNSNFNDDFPHALQKEYKYLSHKFNLVQSQLESTEWKFSKIRPANFPTIRIAQFASFLQEAKSVFFTMLEIKNIKSLGWIAKLKIHEYWDTHCVFDKNSKKKFLQPGQESIYSIIINTAVPILVAYAQLKDVPEYLDLAINLLESVPAEKNKIIVNWNETGQNFTNALHTQGAIGLFNNYCIKKRCLDCVVGMQVLKTN